ncbi:MAG: hypothetical protein M3Y13_02165 [Armatimonadota bacterium]|nr:hypothetical protein [Armatimonadota bacterium]
MALEDYMEPEVGVAVALTAAVASPQVRSVLRRGAVYGLAGLLMAGDAVSSLAQGVKRGVQKAATPEDSGAVVSEAAAPEILSADVVTATPTKPVSEAHPSTSEAADAAPAAPKRARKTAEATENE